MDAFKDSRPVLQGKLQIIKEKKVLLKDSYKMFVPQDCAKKVSKCFISIYLSL